MDFTLYHDLDAAGPRWLDDLFAWLATYLPAVVVVIVALLFLVPWARQRLPRRQGAVTGTIAAALALAINQPIAHAVDRTRPYLTHPHAQLLIGRSHDPSFPSDHATGAFAIAVAMWFYDRVAGTVLLMLAVVLSFARVYAGTHYPSDVVGGAAIGAAVALLLRLPALRRALERLAQLFATVWDRLVAVVYRPRAARR